LHKGTLYIFNLNSSTNLQIQMITSVAVMQCVERGLVALDQPLSSILPEFKNPLIVTGLDEATGKPIFGSTTHAITLRQLLTHTSGMGYGFCSPLIAAWIKTQPHTSTIFGPSTYYL
jgi:CubicO group peptidase (beta-lactamase class C family)